jgi:poly-gamma-glutamate capsule biosynthesis protein CapA/YwtB (metallophosphatase superfamily)
VMDYGAEGLTDTFSHLNHAGILYMGAGRNAEEAFKPVIVEKKGMKIAFLGFSRVVPDNSWKAGVNHPGVADAYNPNLPAEAVKKAREQADLVIVIAHWGVERMDTPEKYQTDLAHRFIDAGADLVIGGHPHVLQGFEQYRGKWIAYSLGNFIFTTNNVRETLDTMILNASCSKDRKCELNAVPVFTQWAKPVVMNAEDSRKLFEHLAKVSFGAAVDSGGNIVNK